MINIIFNKIINRILHLGYGPFSYFPELIKINNIIENNQFNNRNIRNYIFNISRRLYEIGIMDEELDKLLDELLKNEFWRR